jgi:hypothetical protein
MEGVGQHELYVLNRMVKVLRPFTLPKDEAADMYKDAYSPDPAVFFRKRLKTSRL